MEDNIIGQKFGSLTVIRKSDTKKICDTYAYECKCDCGEVTYILKRNLLNGKRTDCGKHQYCDLTGMRFGSLTVMGMCDREYGDEIKWHCKCDCGNEVDVSATHLKSGHTTSCGRGIHKVKDLTGNRYGRLTIVRLIGTKNRAAVWECKCDCGNVVQMKQPQLHESCGCLRLEHVTKYTRHKDMANTRLYSIWNAMVNRCNNPRNNSYNLYGERGISVCDEWKDFEVFVDWATENGYQDDLSIDRIDYNGNYCPENCRWADSKIQANNTRRNVYIEYNGETLTLSQIAEKYNIAYTLLYDRYCVQGKPIEECFFEKMTPRDVRMLHPVKKDSKTGRFVTGGENDG